MPTQIENPAVATPSSAAVAANIAAHNDALVSAVADAIAAPTRKRRTWTAIWNRDNIDFSTWTKEQVADYFFAEGQRDLERETERADRAETRARLNEQMARWNAETIKEQQTEIRKLVSEHAETTRELASAVVEVHVPFKSEGTPVTLWSLYEDGKFRPLSKCGEAWCQGCVEDKQSDAELKYEFDAEESERG